MMAMLPLIETCRSESEIKATSSQPNFTLSKGAALVDGDPMKQLVEELSLS